MMHMVCLLSCILIPTQFIPAVSTSRGGCAFVPSVTFLSQRENGRIVLAPTVSNCPDSLPSSVSPSKNERQSKAPLTRPTSFAKHWKHWGGGTICRHQLATKTMTSDETEFTDDEKKILARDSAEAKASTDFSESLLSAAEKAASESGVVAQDEYAQDFDHIRAGAASLLSDALSLSSSEAANARDSAEASSLATFSAELSSAANHAVGKMKERDEAKARDEAEADVASFFAETLSSVAEQIVSDTKMDALTDAMEGRGAVHAIDIKGAELLAQALSSAAKDAESSMSTAGAKSAASFSADMSLAAQRAMATIEARRDIKARDTKQANLAMVLAEMLSSTAEMVAFDAKADAMTDPEKASTDIKGFELLARALSSAAKDARSSSSAAGANSAAAFSAELSTAAQRAMATIEVKSRRLAVAEARRQPKSDEEEKLLAKMYGSMSPEDRAFNILLDLGMIELTPDPDSPDYFGGDDEEYCAENRY